VVEGTGDHGCEYMTKGTVVVLGGTGRNFAAGMSGGIAYVYDPDGDFAQRCNTAMVALEPVLPTQEQQEKVDAAIWHLGETDEFVLRGLIEKHFRYTGSFRAREILHDWPNKRGQFVKVFPHEYRRALKELHGGATARRAEEAGRIRKTMGKITGFLEYQRLEEAAEAPQSRRKHWREFVVHLTDEQAAVQGARCMDCGIPFCNNGCPVNNIIPDFNDLVYRQDWKSALDVLHSTNNFPEFTGRVCPAPCEAACTLNINNDPVGIKSIEHAIIDKGWAEGWVVPQPPARRTGRKVAIVGSGPAGWPPRSSWRAPGTR
jgi:ferredoxin